MKTCILHVGMPKTGTSSIQETLHRNLADPAFHYLSLGQVDMNALIALLFSNQPQDHWRFRLDRYSKTRLRAMRAIYFRRIRRELRRARVRSKTLIISAENCWYAPPSDLERLRDFLASEGFGARVIAYIRPIRSYTASLFQQTTKVGCEEFDPISIFQKPGGHSLRSWSRVLEPLARIFGQRNLTVRPFVRSQLVEGCAVRDFCQTVGIALEPKAVIRANESLSADALRFLYAYNRFCPHGAQPSFRGRLLLIQQFENLKGDPFQFHADVFAPIAGSIAAEERTLQERYGIDISEDLRDSDAVSCVREMTDLFRYSRASLDWLAETSGSPPLVSCEGESAGRAVAAQVDKLQHRLSKRTRREAFAGKLRGVIRRIRRGN